MPSVKSFVGDDPPEHPDDKIQELTEKQFTDFDDVERCQKVRAKTPGPSITGSVRLQRSGLRRPETHHATTSHNKASVSEGSKVLITQDDEESVSDFNPDSATPVIVNEDDEFSLGSGSASLNEESEEEEEEEEDGYDTDLEINDDEWLNPTEEFDQSGIKDYIRECNRSGAIPVSYFQKHIEEKTFSMKYHGLGPLGAKAISKPLESNTKIESLDLEGNDIRGEGIIFLCKTIKENLYITDLNVSENGLGSEGAEAICNILKDHTSIKELDLSGNGFRDSDGQYFYTMLSNNASLKRLVLKHNNFEFIGAKWFRDALAENESLRILDLSWNNIRLKGGVFMAEMIKENYGLKYLNLMMNGLGDDGAAAIGAALKFNQCIVELNIMANRITEQGAVHIAKGLLVNDVLETVRIGKNPIGASGAFALLSAVGKNDNGTVHLLDLTDVIVKDEFEILHTNINDQKEFYKLKVIHGGVYYQNKLHHTDVDPLEDFERDPMTKLKRYAEQNKLRLVDLFRQFDKDNSWSVDRDEFVLGVKSTGIDMSEGEIDKLITMLDQDGDGEIDYAELVIGDNANRAKFRRIMKAQEDKEAREESRRQQEESHFDDEDLSKPSSPQKTPRKSQAVIETL